MAKAASRFLYLVNPVPPPLSHRLKTQIHYGANWSCRCDHWYSRRTKLSVCHRPSIGFVASVGNRSPRGIGYGCHPQLLFPGNENRKLFLTALPASLSFFDRIRDSISLDPAPLRAARNTPARRSGTLHLRATDL